MSDLHNKLMQNLDDVEAHLAVIRALAKSDAYPEHYVGYALAKFAAKLDENMHLFIADTRHYSDEQPIANQVLDEMNL